VETVRAIIALGGNVGDSQTILTDALDRIDDQPGCRVVARSTFHRTSPVGGPAGQEDYLNAAAVVETGLGPRELLEVLQRIEADLGRDRDREQRWGPRTCDLDILLYGGREISTPALTVPHPRLAERRFVLEPLVEVAPTVEIPGLATTPADLLAELGEEA
jgi:2-amino-4-hydroxy-6-hydroxymethyldihydropteridine diphosphokinase